MILLCYGLVNYNDTCCTAMRARISYAALVDAASLPLLPHLLQERDGEQERHVVQDELGHLDGEDKQDHCGQVVDSCGSGTGTMGCLEYANTCCTVFSVSYSPLSEVPGSQDLVYWGE